MRKGRKEEGSDLDAGGVDFENDDGNCHAGAKNSDVVFEQTLCTGSGPS